MTQPTSNTVTEEQWHVIEEKADELANADVQVERWNRRFVPLSLAALAITVGSTALLQTARTTAGFRGLLVGMGVMGFGALRLRYAEYRVKKLSQEVKKYFKKRRRKLQENFSADQQVRYEAVVQHLYTRHVQRCPWIVKYRPEAPQEAELALLLETFAPLQANRQASQRWAYVSCGALGLSATIFMGGLILKRGGGKLFTYGLGAVCTSLIATAYFQALYERYKHRLRRSEEMITAAAKRNEAFVAPYGRQIRSLEGTVDQLLHCPRLRSLTVTDRDLSAAERAQFSRVQKVSIQAPVGDLSGFPTALHTLDVDSYRPDYIQELHYPLLTSFSTWQVNQAGWEVVCNLAPRKLRIDDLTPVANRLYATDLRRIEKLTTRYMIASPEGEAYSRAKKHFVVRKIRLTEPTRLCPQTITRFASIKDVRFDRDPGFADEHLRPLFARKQIKRCIIRQYSGGLTPVFLQEVWGLDYLITCNDDKPLRIEELNDPLPPTARLKIARR